MKTIQRPTFWTFTALNSVRFQIFSEFFNLTLDQTIYFGLIDLNLIFKKIKWINLTPTKANSNPKNLSCV